MRALAKALGVQSRTIPSHFKGGLDELGVALAQKSFGGCRQALKAERHPATYITDLFRAVLAAVHGNPPLAKLVTLELSHNYFLNPAVGGTHPCGSGRSRSR
jgi:hypothetical protein